MHFWQLLLCWLWFKIFKEAWGFISLFLLFFPLPPSCLISFLVLMPCHLILVEIKKEENADHFGPLLWAVLVFQKDFAVCRKRWKQDEESRLSAGANFWKYCPLWASPRQSTFFPQILFLCQTQKFPLKLLFLGFFTMWGCCNLEQVPSW